MRKRSLLIDFETPVFTNFNYFELSSIIPAYLKDEFQTELNANQRDAIIKVLQAKDYALILGMPGTGMYIA